MHMFISPEICGTLWVCNYDCLQSPILGITYIDMSGIQHPASQAYAFLTQRHPKHCTYSCTPIRICACIRAISLYIMYAY